MVTKLEFKQAAALAIQNIVKHGDTDIFPFPFENHAFFDNRAEIVELIVEYDEQFEEYLARFSPQNVSALTPVTYSGFRWATQIDPIWNAHFLACVLVLSKKMENARAPKSKNIVFSYRSEANPETGDLFDRGYGWFQFMEHSIKLSEEYEFVVACDISEFYPRLGHHRLENALKQIAGDTPYPKRIMQFLSNYSNTRSFGLPIGGPAARMLSEITINQIDRLLIGNGVPFARFADDYHLFAESREDAYRHLIFLSEKLFDNQGLSLQKAKTRIMTSSEFRATNPLKPQMEQDEVDRELAHSNSPDNQALLQQLYEDRTSPIVRRDIILALAKWGEWYWLSDIRNRFRELSGPERRAFIIASYVLKDEGDHWRKHVGKELNPFERFVLSWAGQKANQPNWVIPL